MDLETFISVGEPTIFNNPCLYVIQQRPQNNDPKTWAYRCGLSGRQQFEGSDRVFGSDSAQYKGQLGRAMLYKNYWLPNKGFIFAALRIKQQLVAKPGSRVEEDADGGSYSATARANFTLVELREMEYHQALDEKGLRWQKDRRNELFVPRNGDVNDIIDALRTVKGEELYLFSANKIREDPQYDPAKAIVRQIVTQTEPRAQPRRTIAIDRKAPVLEMRLNRESIELLRNNNKPKYELLVTLIKQITGLVDKDKASRPPSTPLPTTQNRPRPDTPASEASTVLNLPPRIVNALRGNASPAEQQTAASVVARALTQPAPMRPQPPPPPPPPPILPRVTRAQTRQQNALRRSARVAALRDN